MTDHTFPEPDDAPPGVRTMAIARWVLVGLMGLAAFGAVAYYNKWWMPASLARSAAETEYTCPMHPSVVQDHPGECPICSMTLVPRSKLGGGRAHTDAGARAGVAGLAPVQLSPERVQLIGVRTARVERQVLARELRTVGYVVAREDRLEHIHTRFSGWIERLLVAQTGEKVQKGQALATIYSPELLTAQQEFLNARRWSTHAPAVEPDGHAGATHGVTAHLEDDARSRLANLGISPTEIDELSRTGKPERAQKIRSPTSGYVVVKNALAGLYVQPETELFQVVDLTTVWVLADVYEYEVSRVQLGSPARIQVESYPGESFAGKVRFIYPMLNPDTRTLRVRLELPNRVLRLRPGMYATVFIDAKPEPGLVVPSSAVVDTGDEQYVFVARGEGRFEPRKVTVGFRANEKTELQKGVDEGEQVVTTANFLIDSESRLRNAIEGSRP